MSIVNLIIIGAGELGQQIAHYAQIQGYNLIGFLDDFKSKKTLINNFPILGSIDSYIQYEQNNTSFIVAIGYNHLGKKQELINTLLSHGYNLSSVIAPKTYIDSTSIIKGGCFIMPGTVIDKKAIIENGCVLNCNTTISHDSVIGSCTFSGPGAIVSGFVKVGDKCFLGAGSTLIDNISIKNDVIVGAGAVVTKNLDVPGTYTGVPAKLSDSSNKKH